MTPEDFGLLRDLLKERSGLVVTPEKMYLLESRLTPLARDRGMANLDDLVVEIRHRREEILLRDVTEAMTTNESLFFRDKTPFDHLRATVLPELLEARHERKVLRIWCAACSTGQEPYSVAIVLKENAQAYAGWRTEIIGTDISPPVLEKAKVGLYSQFEVQRGLPVQMLVKYFSQVDEMWQVASEIRAMVNYREGNLLGDLSGMGKFDVIFCRNVLIYFDFDTKTKVLDKLSGHLVRDGSLFLGGAETVLGISEKPGRAKACAAYTASPPEPTPPASKKKGHRHRVTPFPKIGARAYGTGPSSALLGARFGGLQIGPGLGAGWVAEQIAAPPHRLDVAIAAGSGGQLLAQLADEDVDDLELGLIHPAVEMVEEHLLGQGGALAQAEKLEDAVFLAGKMNRLAADLDRFGVEIHFELAGGDDRIGLPAGTPDDGVDAGHELALVERLGEIVVGAEHQALHLVIDFGQAGQD